MGNFSFIKKQVRAPVEPIKRLLHQNLAGMQKARPMKKTIHASGLTYAERPFCPRAYALMGIVNKKPKDQFISTSLRVTFDHGWDMQKRINEDYLVDTMVGDWECLACHKQVTFMKKPTSNCKATGAKHLWEYHEPRVYSDSSGASGGLDAIVDIGKPLLHMVEIKTMVKEQFAKLQAPLAEHRLRTNLYLRMIKESKQKWAKKINTTSASVLYVVKGFGVKCDKVDDWGISDAPFSPYKEFKVIRKDEDTDHLLSISKALHDYRENGAGMPCGICPNAVHKNAKSCSVVKECFSGKYEGLTTWVSPTGEPMHKNKVNVGL